LKKLF